MVSACAALVQYLFIHLQSAYAPQSYLNPGSRARAPHSYLFIHLHSELDRSVPQSPICAICKTRTGRVALALHSLFGVPSHLHWVSEGVFAFLRCRNIDIYSVHNKKPLSPVKPSGAPCTVTTVQKDKLRQQPQSSTTLDLP